MSETEGRTEDNTATRKSRGGAPANNANAPTHKYYYFKGLLENGGLDRRSASYREIVKFCADPRRQICCKPRAKPRRGRKKSHPLSLRSSERR